MVLTALAMLFSGCVRVGLDYLRPQTTVSPNWLEAADASLLAVVADYDFALVSLTADSANSYIQILTFRMRLEIANENVETQGEALQISEFFIERPIFANVIAFITMIIGLVCLYQLPVPQYPQIVPPTIQVSTRYPGASAEVVASTIGVPIEQAVNGVEGSIYMSSTSSSDGSYSLTITFNVGTDLNTALSLVQDLVNISLAQLPGGAQQQGITVRKVSPNILLVASLYSEDNRFDEAFLSNYGVINLQNPLARLPGIGQVRVVGAGP